MKDEQLKPIKQSLDQKYAYIDAASASRLRQAREQALSAYDKKPLFVKNRLPMVFASVALFTVSTFFFAQQFSQQNQIEYQQVMNEILLEDSLGGALLTEDIDIDFYTDKDFYQWLEQAQQNDQSRQG